jgi:hypothetical protein
VEILPSAESLDSAAAKSERELLKRVQAINRYVEEPNGERAVVAALAYQSRLNARMVMQERQQLRIGYGHCAALRGISYLGGGSINKVFADYQRGQSWSVITQNRGILLDELSLWIGDLMRTSSTMVQRLRNPPYGPPPRLNYSY